MASKAAQDSAAVVTPESADNSVALRNGFSAEELRGLETLADVQAMFEAHGITVIDAAEELGDGFALVKNKDQFIGRGMMVLSWAFGAGDFGEGSGFVAVRFVVQEANGSLGKYVLTDGGTGIYATLKEYTERTGVTGGLYVKNGLRKSEYKTDENENAVTHYMDLSK